MKESLHPLVVLVGNNKKMMFFVPGLLEDPEVLSLRLICHSWLGDFSVWSPAAEVGFFLALLLSMEFVVGLLAISVEGPVKTSVSYNYIHLNLLKGKRQIFHFQ